MYDQRSKAQRDYDWGLASAREEGYQEGYEQGLLVGKIQALQEWFGDSVLQLEQLSQLEVPELTSILEQLLQRFRKQQG